MSKNELTGLRNRVKLYFDNPETDYQFQFFLGYEAYGGAAVGEALYAASRIDERDVESWSREWLALAKRVEALALEAQAKGHMVSAREAYLRAFTYYRIATAGMQSSDPRYRETCQKFGECFRLAGTLFDPPFERFAIPYEGRSLPGYFLRPDEDNAEPRATIILIGGGETYHQDMYFWGGAAGLQRGYNILIVDMPGQGATPFDGFHHRGDVEVPMKAVVDYALRRPDVDPERLGIYGISLGGYIVTRAAAHEKRLRACAVSTPVTDFRQLMLDAMPPVLKNMPGAVSNLALKLAGKLDPATALAIERAAWQFGTTTLAETLDGMRGWTVDVRQIKRPMLCMVGDDEDAAFKTQAYAAYEALTVPKTLRVFTIEEGADGHCQGNNPSLAHQVLYDWFDEVFARVPVNA